jgi:hypothetical protein
MADGFDVNEALKDDADTVRQATQGGFSRPSLGKFMVQAIFTLAVLSVIAFLIMLPFVGASKAIPPEVWVGGGVLFMGFFFLIGAAMKVLYKVVDAA